MKFYKNSQVMLYIKQISVCLLAFGGAGLILPECGIWSSFPFLAAAAVLAALIGCSKWLNLAFFGIFGYLLYSFFGSSFKQSLLAAALCLLASAVGLISVNLLKKKRIITIAFAVLILAAQVAVHIYFFGDPVTALRSDSLLSSYAYSRFDTDAVTVGKTYFDRDSRLFRTDVYGNSDITEIRPIYCVNDRVVDSYTPYAELSLMSDKRLELQLLLREHYPDSRFTVAPGFISGYPDATVSPADTTDYSGRMHFSLFIPTEMSDASFVSLCHEYMNVIRQSGAGIRSVTYYGGKAGVYYRKLTLLNTVLPSEPHIFFASNGFMGELFHNRYLPPAPNPVVNN